MAGFTCTLKTVVFAQKRQGRFALTLEFAPRKRESPSESVVTAASSASAQPNRSSRFHTGPVCPAQERASS